GFHPIHKKSQKTQGHGKDFKNLHSHQDRSLAVHVRQISGIAGKKQERQNEETAYKRNVRVRAAGSCRDIERHQSDDDLVKIVVKSAEELRTEEAEEASVLQQIDVSVFSHEAFKPSEFPYFSAKNENNSRAIFEHRLVFAGSSMLRPRQNRLLDDLW